MGNKLMVWGHNLHFNKQEERFFGGRAIPVPGVSLASRYGPKFLSVGYLFNESSFSAFDGRATQKYPLNANKKAVLCLGLGALATDTFFYALITKSDKSLREQFAKSYLSYQVGAAYTGDEDEIVWPRELA